MNILDVVIILILIMSGIIGFKNGFIKEIIGFVCFIVSFLLSYLLKDFVASLIYNSLNLKITFLDIITYKIVSFIVLLIIFSFISIFIIKIAKIAQRLVDATIILTIPSKILGFIIGVIKGYIIILIALIVLSLINNSFVASSTIGTNILNKTFVFSNYNNFLKTVDNIKNNKDISKELLKYKIISERELEKLLSNNKLKDITN